MSLPLNTEEKVDFVVEDRNDSNTACRRCAWFFPELYESLICLGRISCDFLKFKCLKLSASLSKGVYSHIVSGYQHETTYCPLPSTFCFFLFKD